jgi:hypothetical protein
MNFNKISFVGVAIVAIFTTAAWADTTTWYTSANNTLEYVGRQGMSSKFHTKGSSLNQNVETYHASLDAYPVVVYAKLAGSSVFTLAPVYVKPGYEATALILPDTYPLSGSTQAGLRIYGPMPDANPVSFSVKKQDGTSWNINSFKLPVSVEQRKDNARIATGIQTNTLENNVIGSLPLFSMDGALENTFTLPIKSIFTLSQNISNSASPFSNLDTPLVPLTYAVNPIQIDSTTWVLNGWAVFATDRAVPRKAVGEKTLIKISRKAIDSFEQSQ